MNVSHNFSLSNRQKQHFGFLLNIRGISKNSATTESDTELPVNVNNCNQFSQTLRLLKKLITMMKSCVSDVDAISLFDVGPTKEFCILSYNVA